MTRRLTTSSGIVSLLRDLNIRIVQTTLGNGVRGLVRKYQDGYIVLLEESLGFDALLDALKHELCHIILHHLDDDLKTEQMKECEVRVVLAETENPY